jgi:hypothetical protein
MTDEEFQRLKEEEKKHLRAKKRLQRTLKALKQRNEVQGVVQRMKRGAARLLDETESLVDSLRRTVAQDQARFEVALDDEMSEAEDLHEAEEALREERAEELVRRMKAEEEMSSRSRPSISGDNEASEGQPEDAPTQDGPDKTIGRMGDLRADDAS